VDRVGLAGLAHPVGLVDLADRVGLADLVGHADLVGLADLPVTTRARARSNNF
jgi:hypothetical protein